MSLIWQRYQEYLCECPSVGLTLDISRMCFPDDFWQQKSPAMQNAFAAMRELEKGAEVNQDEKRMVGHYWLRDASLAPTAELRQEIESMVAEVKNFASQVHEGKVAAENGQKFENLLVIGIGGSALGPQFVADSLTSTADKMRVFFFDNTDPDGMDRTLAQIQAGGGGGRGGRSGGDFSKRGGGGDRGQEHGA
ncbi:MAG: hypothetical protein FWD61_15260, partial [Phycisphaerales bacterium]|nr:hypothetical protein [Phycisphaerales bacterium]